MIWTSELWQFEFSRALSDTQNETDKAQENSNGHNYEVHTMICYISCALVRIS